MEKRNIDTAPKNGTWIFVSKGSNEVLAYWDGGFIGSAPGWIVAGRGHRINFEPTHWRRHPADSAVDAVR